MDLPVALNQGPAWISQALFLWRAGKEKTDGLTSWWVTNTFPQKKPLGVWEVGYPWVNGFNQTDDPGNPIKHFLFLWLIQLSYSIFRSSNHQKMILSLNVHLLVCLELNFHLSPLCKLPTRVPDNNILSKKKLGQEHDHFIHSRTQCLLFGVYWQFWIMRVSWFPVLVTIGSLELICVRVSDSEGDDLRNNSHPSPRGSQPPGGCLACDKYWITVEFILITKLDCSSFLVNQHCHCQQHDLAECHVSVMFSSYDSNLLLFHLPSKSPLQPLKVERVLIRGWRESTHHKN